jgi:phage/plasmid-associated DNA primase
VIPVANGVASDTSNVEHISQYIQATTKSGEVTELNHMYIADDLVEKYHTVSFQDILYIYDTIENVYVESSQHIEKEVRAIAAELQYTGSIAKVISETTKYVKYKNVEHSYPFNKAAFMLPVQNGILKIHVGDGNIELLPHDYKNKFTFKLPILYNPSANSEKIEQVISSWVEPEDTELLYQIPAQAILQMIIDNSYKKNYIAHGEPHAGKSSYLKLLERFFGKDNFCHVSLHQIGMDRFCTGNLENKMLNIYDDLSDIPLENVGEFKNITGSTSHHIESKNVQAYEGRIYAVHIFACNKPPSVPEKILYDTAFWERFEIIKFPYFFEVDPLFYELTFTEDNLSGYLNVVLKHVLRIIKERKLIVNRTAEEVMDRWNELSDPLLQFINENCTELANSSVLNNFDKDLFYNEYLKFCRNKSINPKKIIPSLNLFTRSLQSHRFLPFETSKKIGSVKTRFKCYRGPWIWNNGQEHMEPGRTQSTVPL